MIVYVVEHIVACEGSEILGVFSSADKAEEFVHRLQTELIPIKYYDGVRLEKRYTYGEFEISSQVVDQE